MKLNEVAAEVTAVKTQVAKAKAEIVQKIADLEAALGDVELPPDAEKALDELKAEVQGIDDVVPDAPPPPA